MTGRPVKDFKRNDGMILHLLTKNGFRQHVTRQGGGFPLIESQTAKLPASRVKELHFGFDGHRRMMHEFMNTQMVEIVLQQMPRLKRCFVDAELQTETWGHLMGAASIRSLGIRTSTEYVRTPASTQWASRKWALAQILNLKYLAGFIQLSSLLIGRLANKEALGLAQALVNLTDLSELSISAGAPALDDTDVRSLFTGTRSRSPIFEFLASLLELSTQQVGESSLSGGCIQLARSLKKLTLRDFYRSGDRGSHQDDHLLVETIQHCEKLTCLEIGLLHTTALQPFLLQVDLRRLRQFAILGCHHVFTERDWANMAGIHLPKAEHHTSDEFASLFKNFLYRHRSSLFSVLLNRPFWPVKHRREAELQFSKSAFNRLWSDGGPPIDIPNGNWQRGSWNSCSDFPNEAFCIENPDMRRHTLSYLEERDRRIEEKERATTDDV